MTQCSNYYYTRISVVTTVTVMLSGFECISIPQQQTGLIKYLAIGDSLMFYLVMLRCAFSIQTYDLVYNRIIHTFNLYILEQEVLFSSIYSRPKNQKQAYDSLNCLNYLWVAILYKYQYLSQHELERQKLLYPIMAIQHISKPLHCQ